MRKTYLNNRRDKQHCQHVPVLPSILTRGHISISRLSLWTIFHVVTSDGHEACSKQANFIICRRLLVLGI